MLATRKPTDKAEHQAHRLLSDIRDATATQVTAALAAPHGVRRCKSPRVSRAEGSRWALIESPAADLGAQTAQHMRDAAGEAVQE